MQTLNESVANYPGSISKAKMLRHGTGKYENIIKFFVMNGYVDAVDYGKDELLALGFAIPGENGELLKNSAEFDELQKELHFGAKYDPNWNEKTSSDKKEEKTMTCSKCGAEIAANVKFCPECGSPVAQEKTSVEEPGQKSEVTQNETGNTAGAAETVQPSFARTQSNTNSIAFTPNYVIRDYLSALLYLVGSIILGDFSIVCIRNIFAGDFKFEFWNILFCLACFILTYVCVRRTYAEILGYQIDLDNRILFASPGLWYGVKREYINIDDIQQISGSDEINTKGLFSHFYKLQIIGSAGTFGSRRYTFHTEHKRDELYSAIAELNQMGTPVV
mgnify:CR=1 FL=1